MFREKKSCDGCTKCCEGWLTSEIHMRLMYPGKPCYLVELGKGCTQYETRPFNPCKTYLCGWMLEEDIPAKYKPSKIGVIVNFARMGEEQIPFANLINSPNEPSEDFIKFMKKFVDKRGIGLTWKNESGTIFIYGNKQFVKLTTLRAKNDYVIVEK